jgi:outer membrane protein TolC
MPERLTNVVRAQRGNAGAIQVVSVLSAVASVAATSASDPKAKAAAALASGALKIVADALAGGLDPDRIDLDQLFVKSPTQLLAESGIRQEEIDRIIRGGG